MCSLQLRLVSLTKGVEPKDGQDAEKDWNRLLEANSARNG